MGFARVRKFGMFPGKTLNPDAISRAQELNEKKWRRKDNRRRKEGKRLRRGRGLLERII
jgi:hypothetical protein